MSAPSVVLGLDAKVYRNTGTYETPTWVEMPNVRDLTLTIEKGEADATTRAAGGWKQSVATVKEATVEFEMVWDTADQGFLAIQNAFFNNTPVDLAIMDGPLPPAPGKKSTGLRALFDVLKFNRNEPLQEVLTASVTLKPTYGEAPVWMEEVGT